MQIIDNLLNKRDFDILQNNIVLNEGFPWYFTNTVSTKEANDGFYFVHNIYDDGESLCQYYNDIKDIFKPHLKWKALLRCKVNLFTSSNSLIQYGFHRDQEYKHKDAIFYLNTNNGYTVFKDGTKVESIANRLLIFENNEEHASTNCTDKYTRLNINFNYL